MSSASIARFLGTLFGIEAVAFFLIAAAHLGVDLPVDSGVAAPPQLSAALVALACALALDGAAFVALTRRSSAWQIGVAAHVAGVIALLVIDRVLAPADATALYRIGIGILAVTGMVLMTSKGKAALGHEHSAKEARPRYRR